MHQDHPDAIASITDYLADLRAAGLRAAEDPDEECDLLNAGLVVWVDGSPWSLSLDDDGWQAFPVRDSGVGLIAYDDTDGDGRLIGGPDLSPVAIVGVLQTAARGDPG